MLNLHTIDFALRMAWDPPWRSLRRVTLPAPLDRPILYVSVAPPSVYRVGVPLVERVSYLVLTWWNTGRNRAGIEPLNGFIVKNASGRDLTHLVISLTSQMSVRVDPLIRRYVNDVETDVGRKRWK